MTTQLFQICENLCVDLVSKREAKNWKENHKPNVKIDEKKYEVDSKRNMEEKRQKATTKEYVEHNTIQ